jgi:hypothetical protein
MLHKLQNLNKRPSPALVIACLALFVSLGGVSYGVATGFIDSREIQNNTIRSKDVRNATLRTDDIRNNEIRGFDVRNSSLQGRDIAFNTLTGADIDESRLGKVPAATAADSAAALTTLKTFAPRLVSEGAAPVALVTHGALTLSAACVQTAGGDTAAQLRIQTSGATAFGAGTVEVPMLTPLQGATTIAEVPDAPGGPAASLASVPIFAAAGTQGLTGDFGLYASALGTGADTCSFNGHVVLEG